MVWYALHRLLNIVIRRRLILGLPSVPYFASFCRPVVSSDIAFQLDQLGCNRVIFVRELL